MTQKVALDVGCGSNKQPGFTGMDRRDVEGVDLVHDCEVFPWPLDDGSCSVVMMSHLMEHIKPWLSIAVMDEAWRVLEDNGLLAIVVPYATSFGFFQDPTHCNPWNEATPCYFDPEDASGLWSIYQPKPWRVEKRFWQQTGSLEVAFRKRGESDV